MDPATSLSLVSSSSNLALKCGKVAKELYQLAESYRDAEVSILSIITECRTIELAWNRIERWVAQNLGSIEDHEILQERLQLSLYSGSLVMGELEKDLAEVQGNPQFSTFRRRTKYLWNESLFKEHQHRIRGQICALTLLIEVMQLPSMSDRSDMLSIKEPIFRDIDDSVRSVIPSRLSLKDSDADSLRSTDSGDLWYIPFSFEDALFTSHVYKRNFRVAPQVQQISRRPTLKRSGFGDAHDWATGAEPHWLWNPTSSGASSNSSMSEGWNRDDRSSDYGRPVPMITSRQVDVAPDTGHFLSDFPQTTHITQKNSSLAALEGTSGRILKYDQATSHGSQVSHRFPVSMVIKRRPLPNRFLNHIAARQESIPRAQSESDNNIPYMTRCDTPIPEDDFIGLPTKTPECTKTAGFTLSAAPRLDVAWPTRDESHLHEHDISLHRRVAAGDYSAAIESIREGAAMLSLFSPSGTHIVQPNVSETLRILRDNDSTLFRTAIQAVALSHGSRSLSIIADSLTRNDRQITEIDEAGSSHEITSATNWTDIILHDAAISSVANYRDDTIRSGIFTSSPTGLQLACVTNNVLVVEYMLSNAYPDLPVHWSHDPFILATKRRCKEILELFFKYASKSVSETIRNLALLLVVNKDCVTAEKWLERDQNDRVRLSIDEDILDLLLGNGASIEAADSNNVSALSMATSSADYGEIGSARIIDKLMAHGSAFTRAMDYNKIIDFKRQARVDGNGELYRLYTKITGKKTLITKTQDTAFKSITKGMPQTARHQTLVLLHNGKFRYLD